MYHEIGFGKSINDPRINTEILYTTKQIVEIINKL